MREDDLPLNPTDADLPAQTESPGSPPVQTSQFEQALRESAELYSRLFENHHAVMLVYEPETFNIIDANPAASRFYGYSRAQLVALKVTDLNGMTLEQAAREYQRVRQTREQPYLLKHRLASGEIRDVESYAGPIELGGKIYQFSIVHDITGRKQAEEELRHERNFVAAILDIIGVLVVVLDREGRIVRFNRACEQLTGYTFAEVKDRHLWDLFLIPEELGPVRQVFEKLRAGDFPLDFENFWLTKDGRRRLIAWSNTALVAADGTIEHVIGTGLDVTERRQAEQEIHYLSSFPQLNPNPVLEIDAAGEVVFCNPGAIKSLEQLGLEPTARLFLPDDMPAILHDLLQRESGVVRREVSIGNAVFAESIYLTPGFGTIRIFATDITERKRMEEALYQFNAELQVRNAELDAFAHTVAHDIKNPLHLVLGHADVLLENYDRLPADLIGESLRLILRSVRKLNSITDSLLLLSQVRQTEIVISPLDMGGIVAEARLRVAHLIDEHAAISVPAEWPRALGYDPWVEEVWANYLSNALKFAGRPARIELGGELQADGMVRFWIRDNGIGISPEKQARLFTAFYQPTYSSSGHGLGLSIVKRIVEKLRGDVAVQSSGLPGEGCTFSFTLPAA
jgi:two-component system sensor histidine kinase/response regulator